jgi:hypothetical protein
MRKNQHNAVSCHRCDALYGLTPEEIQIVEASSH